MGHSLLVCAHTSPCVPRSFLVFLFTQHKSWSHSLDRAHFLTHRNRTWESDETTTSSISTHKHNLLSTLSAQTSTTKEAHRSMCGRARVAWAHHADTQGTRISTRSVSVPMPAHKLGALCCGCAHVWPPLLCAHARGRNHATTA
jgi:hypothetical protein